MAPSQLTRVQTCVVGVVLTAIYLLAYRHGQFGRHSCQCGQSSASMRGQEELLETMPHSERLMVDCMLEQPDTRDAVRQRLRTCLADRGRTPIGGERLSFPAQSAVEHASAVRAGAADADPTPPAHVVAAAPLGPQGASEAHAAPVAVKTGDAADPELRQQMVAARENEAQLPSAPLEADVVEQMTAVPKPPAGAAAAAAAGTLLLITCVGNGRFISASEPDKDWLACSCAAPDRHVAHTRA